MMNDNKSCNVRWKLHGNISRNNYGNVVIGSYDGCFEEHVWLMCRRTRGSPPTGFECTSEVCTNSQCEKRAMHNTEEASKIWMVEVPKTKAQH